MYVCVCLCVSFSVSVSVSVSVYVCVCVHVPNAPETVLVHILFDYCNENPVGLFLFDIQDIGLFQEY